MASAESGLVPRGEGCPFRSRPGVWGASSALPAGSGAELRPKTDLCVGYFEGHRTLF